MLASGKTNPGTDTLTMTKYVIVLNISTSLLVLTHFTFDAGIFDPGIKFFFAF